MGTDLDANRTRRVVTGHRPDLVFDFAGKSSPDLGALCLMLTASILAESDHRRIWLHALPEPAWRILNALGLEHYFELLPHVGDRIN